MVSWYKHDIPKWMDGTESLSDGAYRAYHVIVELIYLNEGPIVPNEHGIAGRCRQSVRAFRTNLKELIEAGKLEIIDGKLANNRAEFELGKVAENRENAGRGGEKSGESRRNRKSQPKSLENREADEASLQEKRTEKTRLEETRIDSGQGASGDAPPRREVLEWALQAYNETTKRFGWPEAKKLNKTRERSMRARLDECGGIEGWRAAMERAAKSDFLTGREKRTNGHANWTPNLDFFLQASSFTKLIEGQYDNRGGTDPGPTSPEAAERMWAIYLERERDGRPLPNGVRREDIPQDFVERWNRATQC